MNWFAIGEKIGRALDCIIGDSVRASFAAKYGKCRGCQQPLSGNSPEQVCEKCHASEVLASALGGSNSGDA